MPKFYALAAPAIAAAMSLGTATAQAAPAMQGHTHAETGVHYAAFGQAINLQRDIDRLDSRIDRALAKRRISWRQAKGLRRDARELDRLFAHYKRGGLTRFEARTIETRLAEFKHSLLRERGDLNRRRG